MNLTPPVADDRPYIELSRFARVLFEPPDIVEYRAIYANAPARSGWCEAWKLADLADRLAADNASGGNLFAGANARTAVGRKGDVNVAQCRTLFADFDHATIDHAEQACAAVGMPTATLTNDSGHGIHKYWRLSIAITPVAFREWQKDLAAMVGSDNTVHNPERVMRLPGFWNLKREPAASCRVIDCDPRRVYPLEDLPIPMRPGSDAKSPVFTLRQRIEPTAAPDRFARCRMYLAKCPRAIAGQYGHTATWFAANTCNRFGLPRDEAMQLMQWFSETMADPPWSPKDIAHKVDDAYRRNAGQHGDKLRNGEQSRRLFTVRLIRGAA
jgi:hypothetical protein